MNDFDYLKQNESYFDAACQSLRPRPVIDAMNNYYLKSNACGGRVRYTWGKNTDALVESTRAKVLAFLKLKPRHYAVSFTLNTTYGLNLLLSQLRPQSFQKIFTSEIEHNSTFLSTLSLARKWQVPRIIMQRELDGSIDLDAYDFTNSIVVVNCASNFDGRTLSNLNALIKKVHAQKGIIFIDAAQAMAHQSELLHKTTADAICFSAHKIYAASLGVIVFKRDLLKLMDISFIGGGMVDDVEAEQYKLSALHSDQIHSAFEPGLQAWAEIISLGAALDWLTHLPKTAQQQLQAHSERLYNFLSSHPRVHLLAAPTSTTFSIYLDDIDAHLLGDALAREGVMLRSGYFCAHYYLAHVKNYPPLLRFSLGYHTRSSDIDRVIALLSKVLA